tara:strand:- start:202 stop:381 length:180 start_codon:yes stop_codon:yes gene_type:complete
MKKNNKRWDEGVSKGSGFFRSMHDNRSDAMRTKITKSIKAKRLADGTYNNGKKKEKDNE